MAYTPRPDSEIIAEKEAIIKLLMGQNRILESDLAAPSRIAKKIEALEAQSAKCLAEAAVLRARDIKEELLANHDRIEQLRREIDTTVNRPEVDKLLDFARQIMGVPNG